MTRIVVDASALVEFVFRTPRSIAIQPLLENGDADLHIPALADVEFASAIVRLLVRGRLSTDRASQALADLEDLPLTRHGHLGLLPRAIALRNNIAVYDAVYVALAEALDADLVTADSGLAAAARAHTSVRIAGS